MKIGALTIAYNEEPLITGCIKCLEDVVDTHIIMLSEKPYHGQMYMPDRTADIAEDLGAYVVRGCWQEEHTQRNVGIKMLQGYDWIITTDADMWILKEDLKKLVSILTMTEEKAFIIEQIAYWKDTNHILVGDDFKPVIAIKPSVLFSHIGCIDTPFAEATGVKIHHINWCEPKDILKKVTTYSHAPEFNGELWYRTHYQTWTPDMKYAVLPNKTFEVSYSPLPEELRCYLK